MGQLISNGINYTGAGGGGAEIEEMTQAEYDALPDTKLTDGVLRAIKDDYSPSDTKMVGLADCYSLSEKEVGCWVDGKPLYQKTVKVTSSSAHSTIIAHGIANIENVVHVFGILDRADSVFLPTNYSRWDSTSEDLVGCHATTTDIALYVNASAYYGKTVYVTLQYTKTTDAAGSGTWTPEGTPTHKYDGSEKVVGTWFGETLYEKTWELSTQITCASNTWTYVNGTSIPNHKYNVEVTAMDSNGTVFKCIGANYANDKIGILNTRNADIGVKWLTVQYTKTTN